jgi:DNA-binding response OmpR family regulator
MQHPMVLVIEDDAAIRRGVVDALESEGYATLQSDHGQRGLALALEASYDLLLLDLVLPGCSGLEVLRALRDSRPTQPVIILTALGDEADRVRGLQLGADDYVVKPFSVRELLARVEAVLRRAPQRPTGVQALRLAGGVVDLDRREARFDDGRRVDLSEREVGLLVYLAGHASRAISREEILRHVWGLDPLGIETRTIDMHIARLREKLGDDPANPRLLVTVRGKGYMLAPPPPEATPRTIAGETA